MANEIDELLVKLSADITEYEGAMKTAGSTMEKFKQQMQKRADTINRIQMTPSARLIDRVSSPARRIQSSLGNLVSRTWTVSIRAKDMTLGTIGRIKDSLFSLPTLVGGGAAAYAGLLSPLKMAGEFEQTQIAFKNMLGGADKANVFIENLQKFAAKTPFEFNQLTDASKKLLAFGFSAESIIPMMTSIGDAAAGLGLGAEGVNRIAIALGQMRAKTKVSGQEMMQLTEAGIKAWDILAEAMGTTTADAMKKAEKGMIPAKMAIDALLEGIEKRFPGLMKEQSKSLFGLWSTIHDTFDQKIFIKWGQGLAATLKPRFDQLEKWIDKNKETIDRWGEGLQQVANEGSDWILKKIEGAFSYLETHYFNNPDFLKLDFAGKINFVFKDLKSAFDKWYDETGGKAITDIASKITSSLAKSIEENTAPIVDAALKLGGALGAGMFAGLQQFARGNPTMAALLAFIATPGPLPVKVAAAVSIPVVSKISQKSEAKKQKLISRGFSKAEVENMPHSKMNYLLMSGATKLPYGPLSNEALERARQEGYYDLRSKLSLFPQPAASFGENSLGGFATPLVNQQNQTSVVVSPSAVQLQLNDPSTIDYDEIAKQVGTQVADQIRKSLENRP